MAFPHHNPQKKDIDSENGKFNAHRLPSYSQINLVLESTFILRHVTIAQYNRLLLLAQSHCRNFSRFILRFDLHNFMSLLRALSAISYSHEYHVKRSSAQRNYIPAFPCNTKILHIKIFILISAIVRCFIL